jgi:glycosyltransferase involved in cell wall biosynthesis
VRRASRVLVTSRYSAGRAQEFYELESMPRIVPELIDLGAWRGLLSANPATASRFTVLLVGRMYLRKRIGVLLNAAAMLRGSIPELEVRIAGNGPCAPALHALARELKLEGTVTWLGDIPRSSLAAEYNRAHLFATPSVQEGFGIVLLEAMAAGKPIAAARAGAIPEVVPHATLVEPESAEAMAEGIRALCGSRERREEQSSAGLSRVEQFDAPRVARMFLEAVVDRASGNSA